MSNNLLSRRSLVCLLAVLSVSRVTAAETNLQALLASAKSGQTIPMPAGEYRGGVTLPAGVSLRGAGYDKTIIDAAGAPNGLAITNGSGATISDLTVRGAMAANILVQGAQRVTVARVRTTGSLLGVNYSHVTGGGVEKVIFAK